MKKKRQLLLGTCVLLALCCLSEVRAEYYENHVDRGEYCMQAKDIRITDTERINWINDGTLREKLLEKSGVFVNRFHASDSTKYWTEYNGDFEADLQELENLKIQGENALVKVPVIFYLDGKENLSITIEVEVTDSDKITEDKQETKESAESIMEKGTETEKAIEAERTTETGETTETRETTGRATEAGESTKGERTAEMNNAGQDEKESSAETAKNKKEMNDRQASPEKQEKINLYWTVVWIAMAIIAALGYGGSLYSDFKVLRKYKRKLEEREGE